MKTVATIEARMTSSRLPGKVLMPAGGKPMLAILIDRLKLVPELDEIVVATTTNATDDPVAALAAASGVSAFRGSEEDVLGRVSGALVAANAGICVEITGDCPLVDPAIVSSCIGTYRQRADGTRYVANTTGPRLGAPHGLDVQVFDAGALHRIAQTTNDPEDREHVSRPFYAPANAGLYNPTFVEFFPDELSRRVWISLDYRADYDLIRLAYETLHPADSAFGARKIVDFCLAHADMTRACLALRDLAAS